MLTRRWALLVALAPACAAPKPTSAPVVTLPNADEDPPGVGTAPGSATCVPQPRPQRVLEPVAYVEINPDDPHQGQFSLSEAVAGLSGDYPLVASIVTNHGTLSCELWEDAAPRTVASFVGLARGLRAFKDPNRGRWMKLPAYEGSTFHRVIPGFMIQGGDPTGRGSGEPGFVLPDEIDKSTHSDRRGLLYMANRGPNTNGMQFFILDAAAPHIDGHYTAFGECGPAEVISRIANVRTGAGDRPVEPVVIEHVGVELGSCRR